MRLSGVRLSNPLSLLRDRSLLRSDGFVAGVWTPGATRETFGVNDPATGEEISRVALLGPTEARAAVEGAEKSFSAWRKRSARERGSLLRKWGELITENAEDLARIMTAEQGKPLAEARGEVVYGASFLEWYAEEGRRVYGETIPSSDPTKRYIVIKQPIGVCAAITPWNFPTAMITRKVAPALAAGCPVVVKPAEQTPLSALALAVLAERAGLPAGVFSVVPGDGHNSILIGKEWCDSTTVRHLSFTGSTEVGRILMRQCAGTVKKLALELGGNAPFIVFDDADLDAAVDGALVSKFRNAGQTCVCANRIFVQERVYDQFVEKLSAKMAALVAGNGFEPGVSQGPLIDSAAMDKALAHIADATAKGGKVLLGGKAVAGNPRFLQPTLISGATSEMLCSREETFGPVAPIFRFSSESEVIALANNSESGLASYLFSRDVGRVVRVAEALESGMVGANTGLISTAEVPFGGVKQSGVGREGGRQGLEEYLETKYICLGGI